MKKNIIVFLVILCIASFSAIGQVGINTNTPHPSSALDIRSDSGGLLTPRMTTSLRNMISSPAEGLVVYDTDESSFYYFNGTIWVPLEGAVMRDNYKLIKDISDLAQELSDGGGTEYQLQTNFLYEINGTIPFDFPIDLNGAYVVGVDVSEDIIENATGGALFVGNTGGSLKALTVDAGGNTMFDLDGGSIVVNNSTLRNASAIGTFDNMNVLLFSIVAFADNTSGLETNSIGSFTMSTIFWNPSNEGTFLDVNGTYNNFQISTGRVIVDAASEVGIDVSSDPTIINYASLANLNFNGNGTLVSGYTTGSYPGYNFTPIWDVNCEGIPLETDSNATGDLNFNFTVGGGAATTFTANDTPVKLNGATTSNSLFRFSSSGNNRLVYEGLKTRYFKITASISAQAENAADIFRFYIAKDSGAGATVVAESATWITVPFDFDILAVPLTGAVELEPGDAIEVWADRFGGSGDLFTVSLNLTVQ